MGKGNCMLMFATMGLRMIRGLISCFCCMCIMGPMLMLIGFTMLVGENNFKEYVAEWNAATANYTAETAPALAVTNLTMNDGSSAYQMSKLTSTTKLSGNDDGVKDVSISSQYFNYQLTSSSSSTQTSSGSFTTQYGNNPTASISLSGRTRQESSQVTVTCTTSSGCSQSNMESKCRSKIGCTTGSVSVTSCPGSSSSSSNRNNNYDCSRTCTYTKTISEVCRVMKWSGNQWQADSSMTYCDYPFTKPSYTCGTSSSVKYQARANTDPYVQLEKISKGKGNFGLTEAQQRVMGLVMMLIGGAIIACLIGFCVAARSICTNHENKAAVYGAFGRNYQYPSGYQPTHQQPMVQNAAPIMAAPQPMAAQPVASPYGSPQGGAQYGQPAPQPGYGQPAPGYGQPQPAGYGQPQAVAYGQPSHAML